MFFIYGEGSIIVIKGRNLMFTNVLFTTDVNRTQHIRKVTTRRTTCNVKRRKLRSIFLNRGMVTTLGIIKGIIFTIGGPVSHRIFKDCIQYRFILWTMSISRGTIRFFFVVLRSIRAIFASDLRLFVSFNRYQLLHHGRTNRVWDE